MAQHRLLLYFHELLIERPDALPTAPSGAEESTNTSPSNFIHQPSASCTIPIVSQLHFTNALSLASPLLSVALCCVEL